MGVISRWKVLVQAQRLRRPGDPDRRRRQHTTWLEPRVDRRAPKREEQADRQLTAKARDSGGQQRTQRNANA